MVGKAKAVMALVPVRIPKTTFEGLRGDDGSYLQGRGLEMVICFPPPAEPSQIDSLSRGALDIQRDREVGGADAGGQCGSMVSANVDFLKYCILSNI